MRSSCDNSEEFDSILIGVTPRAYGARTLFSYQARLRRDSIEGYVLLVHAELYLLLQVLRLIEKSGAAQK